LPTTQALIRTLCAQRVQQHHNPGTIHQFRHVLALVGVRRTHAVEALTRGARIDGVAPTLLQSPPSGLQLNRGRCACEAEFSGCACRLADGVGAVHVRLAVSLSSKRFTFVSSCNGRLHGIVPQLSAAQPS